MQISDEERQAIRVVLDAGRRFGYGNMMAHLATAWAEMLMREWGMDEAGAREGALLSGYPFAMQRDLIERGQWDETGESYRKEKAE